MFTHSAFTENTPEMARHLIDLGYKENTTKKHFRHYVVTYSDNGIWKFKYIDSFERCAYEGVKSVIDCHNNPDLFKAITALRDDSDYMQFFVTEAAQSWVNLNRDIPKGSFELCLVPDRYMGQEPKFCNSIVPAHKATIDELIRHFKKQTKSIKE